LVSYQTLGSFGPVGSLNTYLSHPHIDPLGILLLLPDGFGIAQHNFILADQFAARGWQVIIPDYYEGEPFPPGDFRRNPALSVDERGWPEEKKERLKSLNLQECADRHPHGGIDSVLSG
jgi:dienelactone hydrolase